VQNIETYFADSGKFYDIPPADEDKILSITQSPKAGKFKKYLQK
jgi:hypothetical protein